MNIVKIYKGEEDIPTITIGSIDAIDSSKWLFNICKEEIYIDEELIDTIYHTL
jgi:hypothetical protein